MTYLAKNAATRARSVRALSVGEVGRRDSRSVRVGRARRARRRARQSHRPLRPRRRLSRSARSHPAQDRSRGRCRTGRRGATSTPARSPIAPWPRRPASAGSPRTRMLINEQIGSYTFIGTLLTSLENDIAPDAVADRCGTCTRCLDACPTNAILPNRTVASERLHQLRDDRASRRARRTSPLASTTPSAATSARKSAPGTHEPARPAPRLRPARRIPRHADHRSAPLRRKPTSRRSSAKARSNAPSWPACNGTWPR